MKKFIKDSKKNKTAFWAEVTSMPFIVIGSTLSGVNVVVNPTLTALTAFLCFSVGSLLDLVSSYKRKNMNVIVVGYHFVLNVMTLGGIVFRLL